MNYFYLGQIIGGILPVYLLFILLNFAVFRKLNQPLKERCSLVTAYVISAIIAGYGTANGGEPQFLMSAQTVGISAIIVALLNLKKLELSNKMNPMKSSAIFIAVFLVAFFAVNYITTQYAVQSTVKETLADIEKSAAQDTSDKTKSKKMFDASMAAVQKKFSEINDPDKAVNYATDVFAGHYARTLATVNYCENLGVDLSSYLTTYRELNEAVYKKSNLIMQKSGDSVENLAISIKKEVRLLVGQEISDLQEVWSKEFNDGEPLTLNDVCLVLSELRLDNDFREYMQFSFILPEAHALIMDADY